MSSSGGQWPIIHLSMFLLRAVAGFALIAYQGLVQMKAGWTWLWSDREAIEWDLVTQFADHMALPVASAFAFITAVFFFVSPLLLMLGFLTRLNAFFIFVGLLVTLMYEISLSSTLVNQTMLIYLVVMVFFVLNGGGVIALDRFFQRRRSLDMSPGGLYPG